MILPAQKIAEYNGMVLPFYLQTRRRGKTFGLSGHGYDIRIAEDVTLYPITLWNLLLKTFGVKRPSFMLASSIEKFNIPNNIVPVIQDKSTWARQGLAVQTTTAEAGWRGYLTLELSNHGDSVLKILAGDPIAQVVFHTLLEPTNQPYNGKYQDQEPGAQSARFD